MRGAQTEAVAICPTRQWTGDPGAQASGHHPHPVFPVVPYRREDAEDGTRANSTEGKGLQQEAQSPGREREGRTQASPRPLPEKRPGLRWRDSTWALATHVGATTPGRTSLDQGRGTHRSGFSCLWCGLPKARPLIRGGNHGGRPNTARIFT